MNKIDGELSELREKGCLGCLFFSVVSLGTWIYWRRKRLAKEAARKSKVAGERFDPERWPVVDDLPDDDATT